MGSGSLHIIFKCVKYECMLVALKFMFMGVCNFSLCGKYLIVTSCKSAVKLFLELNWNEQSLKWMVAKCKLMKQNFILFRVQERLTYIIFTRSPVFLVFNMPLEFVLLDYNTGLANWR